MRKKTPYSARSLFRHCGWLLLVIMWLVPGHAFSQITVNGTVTSQASGETLPGVNVLLKGGSTGTVTDMDGQYSLNVPEEEGSLLFSFIGFTSEGVPINGRTIIDVAMSEDVQNMDEVVVVGYGTRV